MIVVINALSAKVGGGKTYLYNLLEYVPKEISKVYVFGYKDLSYLASDNVSLIEVDFPVYNPILRILWERYALPYWLKKLRADMLFCPGGIVNTKSPPNCKTVTMFRNMLPFDKRVIQESASIIFKVKNFLLRKKMLSSMRNADLVIFISNYAKGVIEERIKIKSSVTIPHGISKKFLTAGEFLERPKLPFDGEYILYVSRFEIYKRHHELVEAYSLLEENIREKYKLLIVGGGSGKKYEEVKSYILEKKLTESVFLLDEFDYNKLPSLYNNAKIFTFMSACENCPNILLEAMGAGLPTLCSDYEPMPEFGGDAVRYVSPDYPSYISSAIRELLSDKDIIHELSQAVGEHAQKYKWEISASLTWKALMRVCDS